ncbi:receptor-transporting protein 3-like [Heteronotia binoei]|uniref:receptor-transporting protein 3-like n=1 Tax=Heteronotia binoei TaxID=13085 RepID=UPI00292DABB0|nr:receptor-transporting protein 3-like [Heteronotia binoei]
MSRRGGYNELQRWKERFVLLMKEHEPQDVWALDVSEALNPCPHGWYQYQQRRLFARFECSGCSKHWNSAWSSILFHIRFLGSWDQNQGQVKMWMFRQKCRRCTMARYEEPVFSEKALETILHNLAWKILEKSYGEAKRNPRPCDVEEVVEGPHDERNCEACQHGMCVETHTPWPKAKPTYPAPSMERKENFTRSASFAPSTEWERVFARPVSVTRPTEGEEWQQILAFLFVVIVCLLFLASYFR